MLHDLFSLKRTASHLNWGTYLSFDEPGRDAIETLEGRRLAFEVTSGQLVAAR